MVDVKIVEFCYIIVIVLLNKMTTIEEKKFLKKIRLHAANTLLLHFVT